MKKVFSLLIAVLIVVSICGCTKRELKPRVTVPVQGVSTFPDDLQVQSVFSDRNNTEIYLSKDKFIFTTEDSNSNFGDGQMPMVYDLKTGKITRMVNFDTGGIDYCFLIDRDFYFVSYSNTTNNHTSTNWGYCLFKYNLDNGETIPVFETPNTFSDLSVTQQGEVLFYLGSVTATQEIDQREDKYGDNPDYGKYVPADDKMKYELHMIKDDQDILVMDAFEAVNAVLHNGYNGVYLAVNDEYYKQKEAYFIDINGDVTSVNMDLSNYDDCTSLHYETERIDGKIVSGKFGDYYILEDDIPAKVKSPNVNDCGYQYSINYYLYDKVNDTIYELTEKTDWHYYF